MQLENAPVNINGVKSGGKDSTCESSTLLSQSAAAENIFEAVCTPQNGSEANHIEVLSFLEISPMLFLLGPNSTSEKGLCHKKARFAESPVLVSQDIAGGSDTGPSI